MVEIEFEKEENVQRIDEIFDEEEEEVEVIVVDLNQIKMKEDNVFIFFEDGINFLFQFEIFVVFDDDGDNDDEFFVFFLCGVDLIMFSELEDQCECLDFENDIFFVQVVELVLLWKKLNILIGMECICESL